MAANLSDAESIFSAAIDLATPEECGAYVQSACGGNEALRQRVENLLQAHFRAGNFLEPPATTFRPAGDQPMLEGPGTVIGSYKLLQQIGEGGMGVVFLAEQSRPVQRKVALKIIKPGMDTRQVIARFAAEQQALALMDHPNIARVFDAGATESGRPYFVMELVKGVPITEYCDQQRLTPQQRLDLFIPICHALQHAHQKGIIHRDLKPSNVMVALYDGRPVPKVIDFGVAKATGSKLTERTLFTEFGQVVGTLEYMSPEQAELNQLDVRYAQRHLFAGCALVRTSHRHDTSGEAAAQSSGVLGIVAGHPRGGTTQAQHAALDDGGLTVDRGQSKSGAEKAERNDAG